MSRLVLLSGTWFLALAGTGAWWPYLGLILARRGHDGATVAGLLALMPLARIASGPFWAMVGDRYRMGGRVLQLTSLLSVLAAAALGLVSGVWLVGLVLLLLSTVRSPVGPLMDAQAVAALQAAGRPSVGYGRIRLWGSIGFLVGSLVAGELATDHADAPFVLAVALWASAAVGTFLLPAGVGGPPVDLRPALRALLARPGYARFALATALHGATLTSYDGLYALHVEARGLDPGWTGRAIAVGVLAEVVVLALAGRVLRVDTTRLARFAMLVSVLRWGLTAWVHDPVLLTGVQVLHGVSFGVWWAAGIEETRRSAPAAVAASAQSLYTTLGYGVGPLIGSAVAALLLDRAGTDALFLACAGLSLLAAGCLPGSERDSRAHGLRPL